MNQYEFYKNVRLDEEGRLLVSGLDGELLQQLVTSNEELLTLLSSLETGSNITNNNEEHITNQHTTNEYVTNNDYVTNNYNTVNNINNYTGEDKVIKIYKALPQPIKQPKVKVEKKLEYPVTNKVIKTNCEHIDYSLPVGITENEVYYEHYKQSKAVPKKRTSIWREKYCPKNRKTKW